VCQERRRRRWFNREDVRPNVLFSALLARTHRGNPACSCWICMHSSRLQHFIVLCMYAHHVWNLWCVNPACLHAHACMCMCFHGEASSHQTSCHVLLHPLSVHNFSAQDVHLQLRNTCVCVYVCMCVCSLACDVCALIPRLSLALSLSPSPPLRRCINT
jgi:hypothetical protein